MGLGAVAMSSLAMGVVLVAKDTNVDKQPSPHDPPARKLYSPPMDPPAKLSSLSADPPVDPPAAAKPHLVMMVVDDMGWTDVGYHGSSFPTPVIDGLAKEGVKLDKYYVQQVCSPTRSALMTARYPFRTGLQHTTTLAPGSLAAIPRETATIAEVLKGVGYATHAIGKWHLGYQSWSDTPIGRGFDSHAGYLNGAIDYYSHRFGTGIIAGNGSVKTHDGMDFWRNKTAAWDELGKHSSHLYMDEAKRVLDHHDPSSPLFLYFAQQLMHQPLQEPPGPGVQERCAAQNVTSPIGQDATVGRHTLCTMASAVDTDIGQLVDMLRAKGMWSNTLFWLTTDNGGMTHGVKADGVGAWSTSSNWPLRGGKATLFEGGVRGVSFVSGGFLPPSARGKATAELMMHVDIPATMAKLAGAEWGKEGAPVDGLDVWDAVVGGGPSRRAEAPVNVDTCVGVTGGPPCARNAKYNALVTADGWKLIEANWYMLGCPNTTWCTGAGLYDGWWTNDPYSHVPVNASTQGPLPTAGLDKGGIWLFNLASDPNEKINVAASNPRVVDTMRARLADLAERKNGYREPQLNIPSPRGLPILHNGTWAPFRKLGEALAISAAEIESAVAAMSAAVAASAYWD